ncbi:ATP-binding cassette domain-containing protein [Embleya sp. NBC_00888]|uniref:FHA domain-containing protein n=1 Tax=Embleya sp. NBC_00888 TaxID=2975960 RepID=UPI003867B4A6|nr:ATP-binding cassette domain-containing protein [Embleya sp. NBC_00888]
MPHLTVGTSAGAPVILDPGREHVVGRDPSCAIVLDDRRVSRQHAILRVGPDGWEFVDTNSVNGSWVRGNRVHRVVVGRGCEVLLGDPDDGDPLRLAPESNVTEVVPPRPAHHDHVQIPEPPRRSEPPPRRAEPPRGVEPPRGLEPPYVPEPPRQVSEPARPLGCAQIGAGPHADPRPSVDRAPSMVIPLPVRTLRIGRALDNDLVLTDLMVSRHHAELRTTPGGRREIVDLGSHNGTFLNGQPIERALLGEADLVGIGHATFRLDGQELREFIDTGEVSLEVQNLTVTAGKRVLLDNVSFPLAERNLLAIVGGSGAGKSTLLGALTGSRRAASGKILYDGRDLYANNAELRQRIGLVPQDDILHAQLTARTALRYAAQLRFPEDTEAAERERRVEEVIGELSLDKMPRGATAPYADTKVSSLSGGQRKRVSVAVELLTKPSVLFLDEPTSGLDEGLERSVMEKLRELADDGRTVIVVTHSTRSLNVCDRVLVLAPGGRIAFFGPPDEALPFFGKGDWPEVFKMFDDEPDRDYEGPFRRSELYGRYIEVGRDRAHAVQGDRPQAKPPKPQGWFSQLTTLSRRYLAVISSDRKYLALLAIAPLFLGMLCRVIPGELVSPPGSPPGSNPEATTKLLVLFVISGLMGTATAVNELIKERAIYRRERSAGLSVSAYLGSKIIVLGLISAIQGVVLTAVALVGQKLPAKGVVISPPIIEIGIAVVLSAIAAMAVGLVVSASIGSAELAMPLLVVIAIVQVVLCGGLFPLNGKAGIEQISWLAPARWAFAAAGSTIDLATQLPRKPGESPDPLWKHDPKVWYRNIGILAGQIAVYGMIALLMLRRLDPKTKRKRGG